MKGFKFFLLFVLGLALAGCSASPSSAAPAGRDPVMISAADLRQRMQAGEDLHLLDVRDAAELEEIPMLPGSLNIPLDDLKNRMGELDAQKELIIVCRSGRRAALAAKDLQEAGFNDLVILDGGMQSWQKLPQPEPAQ